MMISDENDKNVKTKTKIVRPRPNV